MSTIRNLREILESPSHPLVKLLAGRTVVARIRASDALALLDRYPNRYQADSVRPRRVKSIRDTDPLAGRPMQLAEWELCWRTSGDGAAVLPPSPEYFEHMRSSKPTV